MLSNRVLIEPKKSLLGIELKSFDYYKSETGVLQVPFRYTAKELSVLENGLQIQFETISPKQARGDHYHYPEYAGEEFYLLKGKVVLLAKDINDDKYELYALNKKISYYVPPYIAHKLINYSDIDAEVIISKFFNYAIKNQQVKYFIDKNAIENELSMFVADKWGITSS